MHQNPEWSESMFLSFFDTEEEQNLKKKFFNERLDKESKDLKTVVSEGLTSNVKTLTRIGTTFVWTALDIQERLKEKFVSNPKTKEKIIHPFNKPSFSLASLSLAVWEYFCLEPNTLYCIAPRQKSDMSSNIERKWAFFKDREDDPSGEQIVHMAKSEIHQKKFKTKNGQNISFPDFYNPHTKTVSYFNGCWYHTCRVCNTKYNGGKDGVDIVKEQYEEICQHNPDDVDPNKPVEIVRECEYKKTKKRGRKSFYVPEPKECLQSRAAYRSGFTEIMDHIFIKSPDKILELYDCSSLYPFVAKTKKFLTGKFFKICRKAIQKRVTVTNRGLRLDGKPFHGFVQAYFIPPKNNLDLPYLGQKVVLNKRKFDGKKSSHDKDFHSNNLGKSYFGGEEHQAHSLCSKCIERQDPSKECTHVEYQRSILSVVSSDELKYMFKIGYKTKKSYIFEMWCFKEENQKPIFKRYMQFLELEKIKHSKIPKNMTPKEYTDAVNQELKLTGKFKLSPQDLDENSVKRSFIKNMANCLFGRLGMKPTKSYSRILKNPKDLKKYKHKMHTVCDINMLDDKLELIMKDPTPENIINTRTNVLIAAQINSYAKMYIHETFMKLQKHKDVKIIAVNADAFFIVRKKDSAPLFKGMPEIFGNYHQEYEGKQLKEFYAFNSRTYSLKFDDNSTVTKAISFNLTYENCDLNFEKFRELLLKRFTGNPKLNTEQESGLRVTQKRTRKNAVKISEFNFSANIAKKRRLEIGTHEITSTPWGYVEE